MEYQNIEPWLFELQDIRYRDFQSALMPTVDKDKIIGVRVPELRKIATMIWREDKGYDFMSAVPHKYYEENNIHAYLINKTSDYQVCVSALDSFLPYVDNWATCDSISPKIFKNHTEELLNEIKGWITSEHTYTVRFAIKMLMDFYSKDNFKEEYLEIVASVKSDEYYVKMMIAWYFATELAYNYDSAVKYLRDRRLEKWTHNKTIQKAVESYRITDEHKKYLKKLRWV